MNTNTETAMLSTLRHLFLAVPYYDKDSHNHINNKDNSSLMAHISFDQLERDTKDAVKTFGEGKIPRNS